MVNKKYINIQSLYIICCSIFLIIVTSSYFIFSIFHRSIQNCLIVGTSLFLLYPHLLVFNLIKLNNEMLGVIISIIIGLLFYILLFYVNFNLVKLIKNENISHLLLFIIFIVFILYWIGSIKFVC